MDLEKENRLALEAEEICNSLQRTSLASHKYERQQQQQHQQHQQQSRSGSARFNSAGRRNDNIPRSTGHGVRSSSSFSSEGGRRRVHDNVSLNNPTNGSGSSGLTRSASHNSFRRFENQSFIGGSHHNAANAMNVVANSQGDMRARRFPPQNVHPSSASIPPTHKHTFCIEVQPKDLEICEQTAETMRNLYSKISFDDEMISKINQLAINAQSFLQQQQQNLTEFYESKRQHDIEVWLASCSEEERRRYWERMQKS